MSTQVYKPLFVLALGREHALKGPAQEFLAEALKFGEQLAISAEVLQEMLHVYRRRGELPVFDSARSLVASHGVEIWDLTRADVDLARSLAGAHPDLSARSVQLGRLPPPRRGHAQDLRSRI